MFTLIRPVSAVLLAVFAYFAAVAYGPVYDPEIDLGTTYILYAVGVGFVVGWVFLGGMLGRALWFSIYASLQAVVLTAVVTAGVLAVGETFTRGYRRQYTEVMEAVLGYFDIVLNWLGRALVADYLIALAVGAAVVGVSLHVLNALFERRRNER